MPDIIYPTKWVKHDIDDIKFIQKLNPSTYHIMAPFGPLPDKDGTFMVKEAAINIDLIPENHRRKLLKHAGLVYEPKSSECSDKLAELAFDESWSYPETKQFASYMEVIAYLSKRAANDNERLCNGS